MSKQKPNPKIQFRLDQQLYEQLVDFCERTNRDIPETCRALVKMLLRDGPDAAEAMLSRGLRADEVRDDESRVHELFEELRSILIRSLATRQGDDSGQRRRRKTGGS